MNRSSPREGAGRKDWADSDRRSRRRRRGLIHNAGDLALWLASAAVGGVALSILGLLPAELSHGAAFAFALAVLAFALDLTLGVRRLMEVRPLLLGAIGLVLAWPLAPDAYRWLIARMAPPARSAAPAVSVIEFNLWDLNPDMAHTIAWLKSLQPDILVLAEAREHTIRELEAAFPDYPTLVGCEARPYCGTVILSRFGGRVIAGGRWVSDGLKFPPEPGVAMALAAVELDIPDETGRLTPVPVVATHMDRRHLSSIEEWQVQALIAAVNKATGGKNANLILAGDFNASPWSLEMRRIGPGLSAQRASLFISTWPSGWSLGPGLAAPPFLAIDQVYLGCGWRALEIKAGPAAGSDHRPLMAQLQLAHDAPGSRC